MELSFADQPDPEHQIDHLIVWFPSGQSLQERRLFVNREIQHTWMDREALAALLQALDPGGSSVIIVTFQPMTMG